MQNAPLIVQSDRTILLDVHAENADECRNNLLPFAELERSPEHLHTYRLTPLSLWNAKSAGFQEDNIIGVLKKYSKFEIPQVVEQWIKKTSERFGCFTLLQEDENTLCLFAKDEIIFNEINSFPKIKKYLTIPPCKKNTFLLPLTNRGIIKQELLTLGYPVKDLAPLKDGEPLNIFLKDTLPNQSPFIIRDYQKEAAHALVGDKGPGTGFGTIVLPCGAGKTIVGMYIMSLLQTNTLIISTNISAVHQWIRELTEKTNLQKDQIAEYTGHEKSIKEVTIATYQILTWRKNTEDDYPHFSLFRKRAWGLIIYDEVHMLPAPVFRVVAELQAVRRVGLTATLIREDGNEGHVFSLVGPKRYDAPWKELECSGWIASAKCVEVRLDLPDEKKLEYATCTTRIKHRIASENISKTKIVQTIVSHFTSDKILIIGQYIEQLEKIASLLNVPIITGKTPNLERDKIYENFRQGNIRVLVVSKVANFAIDLPDASMAIQVSGTFGSRQEEAQRLGRILRPKQKSAIFFTLITRGTVEEDFGSNRQKFLAEQGYQYQIIRYNENNFTDELTNIEKCENVLCP